MKYAGLAVLLVVGSLQAAEKKDAQSSAFYVYSDFRAPGNHYIPSGYMGDYGDIKIDEKDTSDPVDGKNAIKVTYTAEAKQGAEWAGVYWQNPANNWGSRLGGYNLNGKKRLTFWAKGAKGGEFINEFKVGGITGEYADSGVANITDIELTNKWKKYTIDLANAELSQIAGGFCWAASREKNPNGFVFYLDEIRFEE